MTVATLRPNATYNLNETITPHSGSWAVTGAGGVGHTALSDDSDASYISTTQVDVNGYKAVFELTTVSVPAGAIIKSITIRVRHSTSTSSASGVFCRLRVNNGTETASGSAGSSTTIVTDTIISYTTSPAGVAWTQADIDALQIVLQGAGNPVGVTKLIYEVYVDVLYNEIPVTVVTAPTEGSSVTTTTKPTISWTYSDPEGDTQERYRIKIFSAAQYGAGGFDPETSTPTWDSGEVFSAATSFTLTTDLVNGTTYRAYVKTADAGSNGRYSLWDNNTFTITVTPPPTPTLVVTAQLSNASGPRNKLDITRVAGPPATTYMVIEYQDTGTTTWTVLRNGTIVNSPDGTTFTIYDYEIKPGIQRSYRAKAVLTV